MTTPSNSQVARGTVEPSVGELVLELADQLRQMFIDGCAELGLTFMETRTLRYAARERDQSAIIDSLGLAPTTVSALLGTLERKGLLTRSRSRGDYRRRVVELTVAGRAAVDQLDAYLERRSPLIRSLDENQFETLRSILLRLREPIPDDG